MNLVLITSVIHPYCHSVFSSTERLKQLIDNTIKSVREKIPDSYICVLEGSSLSEDEETLVKSKCDELHLLNVSGYEKTNGELSLLVRYLNSESFETILPKVDNLIKISGRYELLNDFEFNSTTGCVIKNELAEWSGNIVSETRYYKVTKEYIQQYIENLSKIFTEGVYIDIEHSFYKYNVVPCETIIPRIGLGGCLAPNGQYIED